MATRALNMPGVEVMASAGATSVRVRVPPPVAMVFFWSSFNCITPCVYVCVCARVRACRQKAKPSSLMSSIHLYF